MGSPKKQLANGQELCPATPSPVGGTQIAPTVQPVSNQHNPAARHCTGMSAAAERGMVTRNIRLYEGYGDLYIPRISGS